MGADGGRDTRQARQRAAVHVHGEDRAGARHDRPDIRCRRGARPPGSFHDPDYVHADPNKRRELGQRRLLPLCHGQRRDSRSQGREAVPLRPDQVAGGAHAYSSRRGREGQRFSRQVPARARNPAIRWTAHIFRERGRNFRRPFLAADLRSRRRSNRFAVAASHSHGRRVWPGHPRRLQGLSPGRILAEVKRSLGVFRDSFSGEPLVFYHCSQAIPVVWRFDFKLGLDYN